MGLLWSRRLSINSETSLTVLTCDDLRSSQIILSLYTGITSLEEREIESGIEERKREREREREREICVREIVFTCFLLLPHTEKFGKRSSEIALRRNKPKNDFLLCTKTKKI